jgi:bifunctional non-homologous end joining protein LigD
MAFQRRKPAAIGVKAHFPGFVEPALASPIEKVRSGERWIHEIQFDGCCVQLQISNDTIKVLTRRGYDWTASGTPEAFDSDNPTLREEDRAPRQLGRAGRTRL